MSTIAVEEKTKTLFEYLDGLSGRADQKKLGELLNGLDVSVADFTGLVEFDDHQYRRNLVRRGEFYQALLLCWRSGHRTPIHNHPGAVGGVRVLQGIATETLFEFAPCGLVKPSCSRDLPTGGVVTLKDPYVHQVSNLQAKGDDLITLHVYSPPLPVMDTYSLTDRSVGEFRPVVFEHTHGSGI